MKFSVLPFLFMIPTSLLSADFDGLQLYVMSQATNETFVMERTLAPNGTINKNLFKIVNSDNSQFKYCRRSNDLSALVCNSIISGPSIATYRRTHEITKNLRKSVSYLREVVGIGSMEISAYYSCHTGCTKEMPFFIFTVLQTEP